MIRRLYKQDKNWVGEFECPKCHKSFKALLCNIQSGNTKSCGCDSSKKPNDLVGQKFGRLTVIKYLRSDKNGPIWQCKCSCDKHTVVEGYGNNLIKGHTQSCGCLQKERASQAKFKDLSGQKFGKLTPLYIVGKYSSSYLWHCKCDCGNYTNVISSNLISGNTRSCGCIKSYGEEIMFNFFKRQNIKFEYNKTFSSLINPNTQRHLYLDFYLPDYHCGVECDGEQHSLINASGYYTDKKLAEIKNRDKIKQQWCDNNGITLYRIKYPNGSSLEEMEKRINECMYTIQKSLQTE